MLLKWHQVVSDDLLKLDHEHMVDILDSAMISNYNRLLQIIENEFELTLLQLALDDLGESLWVLESLDYHGHHQDDDQQGTKAPKSALTALGNLLFELDFDSYDKAHNKHQQSYHGNPHVELEILKEIVHEVPNQIALS